MDEFVDLLFEDVQPASLRAMLDELAAGAEWTLQSETVQGGLVPRPWRSAEVEAMVRATAGPAALSLAVDRLEWPSVSISSPMLQVIRHSGTFDIELSFTEGGLHARGSEDRFSSLQTDAVSIRRKLDARAVICGYEPACDEEMRLFTDESPGRMSGQPVDEAIRVTKPLDR